MRAIEETNVSKFVEIGLPDSLHETYLDCRETNVSAYCALTQLNACEKACREINSLYHSGMTGYPIAKQLVGNVQERINSAIDMFNSVLGLSLQDDFGSDLVRFDKDSTVWDAVDCTRLHAAVHALTCIADSMSALEALTTK